MSKCDKFFLFLYQKRINIFIYWQIHYVFFSEICSAYKFHKSDDGGTFRWYNESSAFFYFFCKIRLPICLHCIIIRL